MKIKIIKGDITKIPATVIVNAANNKLEAGGGVCGAIYKAAGPRLGAYVKGYMAKHYGSASVETGSATLTPAFEMENCEYILHAVGPIYNLELGEGLMNRMLYEAYTNSLYQAYRMGAKSISIPAISTGIYGFPMDKALDMVHLALRHTVYNGQINLICFDDKDLAAYKKRIKPWKIKLARRK